MLTKEARLALLVASGKKLEAKRAERAQMFKQEALYKKFNKEKNPNKTQMAKCSACGAPIMYKWDPRSRNFDPMCDECYAVSYTAYMELVEMQKGKLATRFGIDLESKAAYGREDNPTLKFQRLVEPLRKPKDSPVSRYYREEQERFKREYSGERHGRAIVDRDYHGFTKGYEQWG